MKIWIIKNKVVLLISTATVILLGLALNHFQTGKVPAAVKEQASTISTNTSAKETSPGNRSIEVKEEISIIHTYLNNKLCWGRYQSFNKGSNHWQDIEPTFHRFTDNLDVMIAVAELNENLQADLIVARKAFTYALENEDNMTLLYLHRIFHDLDAEINNKNLDKFGVSSYANGDISKVWNHITPEQ
jgi:hypothetical protein